MALEAGLRAFVPKFDPSGQLWIEKNAQGLYLGAPNTTKRHWARTGDFDVTVNFNQYGLRDAKDLRASNPDDWFVVGDSFSFGWGIEETQRYSNIVEQRLGPPVYNVATLGNFDQYDGNVRYAERQGARIKRLILGVCMENDLKDYETGENLHQTHPVPMGGMKEYLEQRSAAYQATSMMIHAVPIFQRLAMASGVVNDAHRVFNLNFYSETFIRSSARRIARVFEGRQGVVLIIPARGLWVGDNKDVERRVQTEFINALEALNIRVVNPTDAFEAQGNPLAYHFRQNGHWNVEGHRVAGELIAAAIGQ